MTREQSKSLSKALVALIYLGVMGTIAYQTYQMYLRAEPIFFKFKSLEEIVNGNS